MLNVVDLFCGAGGLSAGFKKEGFSVTGVDINPWSEKVFSRNGIGDFVLKDLKKEEYLEKPDILTGGPPCRPWSSLNLSKHRKNKHPDYILLKKYFQHVIKLKPEVFLMENVTHVVSDPVLKRLLKKIDKDYSTKCKIVCYSDWGAAIRRHRLIIAGFRDGGKNAEEFFIRLEEKKSRPKTVREVISRYENMKYMNFPDHVWPKLTTIHKYMKYYRTNKFGWYRLYYDKPAPSFGNIMKTYIIHPLAGVNGIPLRTISVREAMAIMGFDSNFIFPEGIGMGLRYQMVADAVSPVFSRACAHVIRCMMR